MMQITHATEKKNIWIFNSGSSPSAKNKLNITMLPVLRELLQTVHWVREFLSPIMEILSQSVCEMSFK